MYAGLVVERGPVDDVFARPAHPYTKGLLGCLPRLDRRGPPLEPIPGTPPSLLGAPSGCAFHERCPLAEDVCALVVPALVAAGPTAVACHVVGSVTRAEAAR
jgi:oligopeptide/dipeptide ABC transporter ATP-binding protein